ncbi:hypothetical protein HYDPIDRAFT_25636 [Hydnomerulius pinastri MD-312]|nr:hypothetical protein HYDPIDRAFT_25636 [Hydnomerulius pinastri MD-312]
MSLASVSSMASVSSSTTIGSATSNGLLRNILPPEIEEQFVLMEHQVHLLGTTLYKLKQLCPDIKSTPPILALANNIETSRETIRNSLRSMQDRLCVPFTIFQPEFQSEETEVELNKLEARFRDGPMFLRRLVSRGPRKVNHGPGDLQPRYPFALDVEYSPDSDYASWKVPYKFVFTPDEMVADLNGDPLPALSIDVDEKGLVQCAWRKGKFDPKTNSVRRPAEEVTNPESGRVPAHELSLHTKVLPVRRKARHINLKTPTRQAPARLEAQPCKDSNLLSSTSADLKTPETVARSSKKRARSEAEDGPDSETPTISSKKLKV